MTINLSNETRRKMEKQSKAIYEWTLQRCVDEEWTIIAREKERESTSRWDPPKAEERATYDNTLVVPNKNNRRWWLVRQSTSDNHAAKPKWNRKRWMNGHWAGVSMRYERQSAGENEREATRRKGPAVYRGPVKTGIKWINEINARVSR